jgi:pheromone shutdown-related protein TraB
MGITIMSQTQKVIECNGRKITLIGTAHVSKESVEEVKETIKTLQPDCVAIELDEKRADSIQNSEKYKELDIVNVLRRGEGFLLMANLILSSFQKRMGDNIGVKPGDEMLAAMETAKEMNVPFVMVDRPIQITLKRAWAKNSFWGKMKLLSSLIASAFSNEEVSEEEIEKLKKQNEMDSMMTELAEYMPVIKEVLIDERDQYLASSIWKAKGNKIVAVLGAGHLPGVVKHLEALAKGEESDDVTEIASLPKPGIGGKIAGWIFPVAIVALLVAGMFVGGAEYSLQMLVQWIIWNGSLSALGALLALGHPLTILVGFVGAPIATLNPLLGVGLFTGLVQAWVRKPKVQDLETLNDDVSTFKGYYKNRLLKVLLVFFLSSIGGVIGNFIAVPTMISGLF